MHTRQKLTATCAVAAASAMSLVGLPAANAQVVDQPLINEFVTDTAGVDMVEYVEVLVPENYDTSNLYIAGIEGDANSNQGTAVHSYPLGSLNVDDGRLVLTTPLNGLQNGSLTLALTEGEVSTGTTLDPNLDGELTVPEGVELLDVVGLNDGDTGDIAWGPNCVPPSSMATAAPSVVPAGFRTAPTPGFPTRITVPVSTTTVPQMHPAANSKLGTPRVLPIRPLPKKLRNRNPNQPSPSLNQNLRSPNQSQRNQPSRNPLNPVRFATLTSR